MTREALVLPAAALAELDSLVARCRARDRLWESLGPTLDATANPGVRLLFAGESGTGKTLAASYVATALAAPLWRCDLAAVMNKYVGESEKNLGLLLDAAEAADVILLFDEADALFGRRGESQETGERYANMLTNFLLTRIEHHAGIVILTANSRVRIDQAFQRRFDAVLDFPPPGAAERLALWKSHLGARAPGGAALARLARFVELPGGAIRNAVVSAAAHAPGAAPLAWADLVHGLAREYRKLGRSLPAALAEAPPADPGGEAPR